MIARVPPQRRGAAGARNGPGPRWTSDPRPAGDGVAAELLGVAQLTARAADTVETLSGGMKRRLTIARPLVNDPS